MIIKSIELKNFRQYVDERIDFTSDQNKKVTIIHGQNHIGKTTLIKALMWCLYKNDESFKNSPVLLNLDIANVAHSIGNKVTVSVAIELEHNGFRYSIRTEQAYSYLRDGSEARFVAVSKDPIRRILKMTPEGDPIPVRSEDVDKEIESILPSNLKDYFFYDGENNKIDDVATRSNLSSAVRNIMGLDVRDELIRLFEGRLYDSFSIQLQASDQGEADDIQADIDDTVDAIDAEKANNEQLIKDSEELRKRAAEIEVRIKEHEDAEKLQKSIETLRRDIADARSTRDRLFEKLCSLMDSAGSTRPGLAGLFASMAFRDADLDNALAGLQVTERAYAHQSEASIDEIIQRGVCICGLEIKPGDDHYKHLLDAKNYVRPRDYGASIDSLKKRFSMEEDAADSAREELSRVASNLKSTIQSIERFQNNLSEQIKSLEGFSGDVGEWRREVSDLLEKARKNDWAVEHSQTSRIPDLERKIDILREKKNKLMVASEKNVKIERYLSYVKAVRDVASKALTEKKSSIAEELEREVNNVYSSIMGNDGVKLVVDLNTYNVSAFLHGKKVNPDDLATSQKIAKNLAFVVGLIYLAKNKDKIGGGDGELDLPDDYPLVIDAPFSAFDKGNVVRACQKLPEYCSQLIITLLDKDYDLAADALKPYVDKSYLLETSSTNTNSHFTED